MLLSMNRAKLSRRPFRICRPNSRPNPVKTMTKTEQKMMQAGPLNRQDEDKVVVVAVADEVDVLYHHHLPTNLLMKKTK